MASVLAGNTDENVKILPYKVVRFGTDTCAASAVLAAMEDAVAKGARVLNMSLSTSQNRAGFAAMMDKAAALGVAVCCSAGNVGAQISNRYPSALPQAITVSAVTADKTVAGFPIMAAWWITAPPAATLPWPPWTAAVLLLLQLPPAPLCPAPMGRPAVRCC